jgi:hypothetical protein
MSIDLLERGAAALGDLVDEVVFVGGATVTLWITDPAAPPPRPTKGSKRPPGGRHTVRGKPT